jgi:pyrimidine-nucleoside phosphorylase
MTLPQFRAQLATIGLVLAGQSVALAPADGKLYALRDCTGTVANKSLIAASIMSKKLASGADAIVLDVKMGNGAFVHTVDEANELARIMVDIGRDADRQVVAIISDMNQPLGHAIGNALEVKEALDTLRGDGPRGFWLHCLKVASYMLLLAGKANSLEEAELLATEARDDGRALQKFRDMVQAQGGNVSQVDDPQLLPQAQYVEQIRTQRAGVVVSMDTAEIGWAGVHLGGGRLVKSDIIDHAVGFILPVKVGDRVEDGAVIGTIHANDRAKLIQAREEILAAITISDTVVERLPNFYGVIQ